MSEEKRVSTALKKITWKKKAIIFHKNPSFDLCFRGFPFITGGVLILGYIDIIH
jgi:hypothetical protein